MPAQADPTAVLRGSYGEVQCVCFASSITLFSGDSNGEVRLWDLEQHRTIFSQRLHETNAGVIALHYLPSSPALLSEPLSVRESGCFNYCRCAVWPPPEEVAAAIHTEGTAPEPNSTGAAGASAPEGRCYVASSAGEATDVAVWMLGGGRGRDGEGVMVRQDRCSVKHGMAMALRLVTGLGGSGPGPGPGSCPGPGLLLVGYEDGVAAVWDLRAAGAGPLAELRLHTEPIMAMDVCARTAEVLTGGADTTISCCRLARSPSHAPAHAPALPAAGSEAAVLVLTKQLALPEAGVADLAVRPDGKIFAAGAWDGKARVYSVKKKEPLAVLKYHRAQVAGLAFSPCSRLLATASRDSTIALWSIYPPQQP